MPRPSPGWRALCWSVLLPLGAFAALMARAMALYPGGTWEDPGEAGYSVLRTYFCDLLRPVAINGAANPGASVAEWSLIAFSLALLPFFLVAPLSGYESRPRLAAVVRISGALASAGGVAIILVPSYKVGSLVHGLVILTAAVPGLTAAVCATVGAHAAKERAPLAWAAALATSIATAWVVVQFAWQLSLHVETTRGLAFMQKVAVACAIAWMLSTVAAVLRGERARG